jgi:N6-adenosine-specific RNA methylase IME4
MKKFGTIIVDPPWPYQVTSKHKKLTGYSDVQYKPLTIAELAALPVGEVAADDCALFLWTTWPFVEDAMYLIKEWGFKLKTGLPWVKASSIEPAGEAFPSTDDDNNSEIKPKGKFKPKYGVGYWLIGCSEPILVASRGRAAVRTTKIGLLSRNAEHSRKPDTLYELAEMFPKPRLEIFARRPREGWAIVGNEAEGDEHDIRVTLPALASYLNKKPKRHPVR